MIQMQKSGAEVADKIAEIKRLRGCEAVRTAQRMAQVSSLLDTELRMLQKAEREGKQLIEQGVTLAALDEILKAMEGMGYDA